VLSPVSVAPVDAVTKDPAPADDPLNPPTGRVPAPVVLDATAGTATPEAPLPTDATGAAVL